MKVVDLSSEVPSGGLKVDVVPRSCSNPPEFATRFVRENPCLPCNPKEVAVNPRFREGDVVVATRLDFYSGIQEGSVGVVLGFGSTSPYADPSRHLLAVYWYGGRHEAIPVGLVKKVHHIDAEPHPLPHFSTAAQERAAKAHAIRDGFEEWMIGRLRREEGRGRSGNPSEEFGLQFAPGYASGGLAKHTGHACRLVDRFREYLSGGQWWTRVKCSCGDTFECPREMLRHYPTRRNPSLMLVTGNPPRSDVERAWAKFHQRKDARGADLLDLGEIRGAPAVTFGIGHLDSVDLGQGDQRFSGRKRPWLACDPDDHALWIVSQEPIDLGHFSGQEITAVTYDPPRASGKEPSLYVHHFSRPLPRLAPVGSPHKTRSIRLDGGRYRVGDWLYD